MKPQRFPAALLAALGIKASETPQELGGVVGPSLEMLPFYVADRLETVSSTQAGVTAIAVQQIQVPAAEYWLVWVINAIVDTISAPGAIVKLQCGVQTPDGAGPALASMTTPAAASIATEQYHLPAIIPTGLLLRPGSFVFAGTEVDPGAQTFNLTVRALIARLSATS